MQALALKPSFGVAWIRAGWRLFRTQPLGFIVLLVSYWLLLFTASMAVGVIAQVFGSSVLIATIGGAFVAVLTPALTVGFVQACREASRTQGRAANPLVLFTPFRAGRAIVRQLLWIGVVEVLALTLVITFLRGNDQPVAPPPAATQPAQEKAAATKTSDPKQAEALTAAQRDEVLRTARIFPFYLLIELILWYAPLLAAWHRVPAAKAIFFSAVAVWRNLGAFVVYGAGWLVIWFVVMFVFGGAVTLVAGPNLATVTFVPIATLLGTWMFCSKYATYESVFVDPDDPTRVQPVDDPTP